MLLYNSLRLIAYLTGQVRNTLNGWAVAVRNVWLIGTNLYNWLVTLSSAASQIEGALYSMAGDWLDAYNELKHQTSVIPGLSTLLYYLDDFVSLVIDFPYHVLQALKARFPDGWKFIDDPIAYILETLYRYTGLSYEFIHNPLRVIDRMISAAIGDIRNFLSDPWGYILAIIWRSNPTLYNLMIDPDGFLLGWIFRNLPQIEAFLRDPDGFIVDHFIDSLERILDLYETRLLKLGERLLNSIF